LQNFLREYEKSENLEKMQELANRLESDSKRVINEYKNEL